MLEVPSGPRGPQSQELKTGGVLDHQAPVKEAGDLLVCDYCCLSTAGETEAQNSR
jgi:hypothetical protein